eukprot:14070472-Alexandrium_andersonii.AAC.1
MARGSELHLLQLLGGAVAGQQHGPPPGPRGAMPRDGLHHGRDQPPALVLGSQHELGHGPGP